MRKELDCSLFRAMDVIGDHWTLMVLREAFMGVRRFTEMQRDLGVARNVLTDRLNFLVDAGVLERRQYQRPPLPPQVPADRHGPRPAPSAAGADALGRHLP